MNKEDLFKEIMKLPKVEKINPISTMNSINVDDLMSAVDRLNKVPDYNDLLKENKQLKEKLDCDLQWALKYEKQVGNWNKLKIYIKTEIPEDVFTDTEWFVSILDKMQELERRDSNE